MPLSTQDAADAFAQVLARARRHDEEAVAALYQRAMPTIYRYVLARRKRPDLAEDIVAEVFLTMVEAISDLRADHEAGFFAWLLRIAQGKIARALQQVSQQHQHQQAFPENKTASTWPGADLIATDLASDPEALQEWREVVHDLGVALGSLSDEQQIVIIGRFLAGQSIESLAQGLGKHPGAIRALQFRALGTLAARMGQLRTPRHGKGGRA